MQDPSAPIEPPADADAAPAAAAAPVPAPEAATAASTAAVPAELSPAACAQRLAELFPALFAGPAKPIKLRIQADIQQRAPGIFSRKSLSAFLHRHTTSTAYLKALAQQAARIDLDGVPAGEIAEEHRSAASAELERRRGLFEARREAERQQQRQAEAQARAEQAEVAQARRERSALLRAFETTTLTRANFCALKGLTELQLDEQLALARKEAVERAAWLAAHTQREPHDARRRAPAPAGGEPVAGAAGPGRQAPQERRETRPPRRDRGPRPGRP